MDKVLVDVYVPLIESEYNLFIPINRKIGSIKKIIGKAIVDLTDERYEFSERVSLYNKVTNCIYEDDCYVINTDIRNGTKLILL